MILNKHGAERVVHSTRMFEVVQQDMTSEGRVRTFEFVRRCPGTRVIVEQGGKVLLIREFRYELGREDYRLPGGKAFDDISSFNAAIAAGASVPDLALAAARRELAEETGVEAKSLDHIHTSKCGATVEWDLYYFHCDSFEQSLRPDLELGENIRTEWRGASDVIEMCVRGEISEERSALVLLRSLRVSQDAGSET
jgi:ADP-ribose pyrophosphatase